MNHPAGHGAPDAAAPPVCPRHPERESYVRCQRCGRPTCIECQRPAAVGVHCVDCATDASRSMQQSRGTGGVIALKKSPLLVTYSIIGICVVMFIAQLLSPWVTQALIDFTPYLYPEPWRLVTGGFLHDDSSIISMHLIMNMLSLWFLGRALEPALGHWRFAALFLVGVLGGTVGVAFLGDPLTPTLGASGGIFAIGGALMVALRKDKQNLISMGVILAINLVYGFTVGSGVSWQAHVGGLVTGVALGFIFASGRRLRSRTASHLVLVLVLAAVLCAAGLWRSYSILTGAVPVG